MAGAGSDTLIGAGASRNSAVAPGGHAAGAVSRAGVSRLSRVSTLGRTFKWKRDTAGSCTPGEAETAIWAAHNHSSSDQCVNQNRGAVMKIRTVLILLALLSPGRVRAFEFKDGDRVVLIGSTLIEREQRYGYWEAAITAGNPDKNITFRNLGWSGDTVWGEARAGFGTPADGYKQLIDHVKADKPTVMIV